LRRAREWRKLEAEPQETLPWLDTLDRAEPGTLRLFDTLNRARPVRAHHAKEAAG
jgi:hypothetical protein